MGLPALREALTARLRVRVPLWPAASAPTFHCTTPSPPRLPPSLAESRLVPAGRGTRSRAPALAAPVLP